MREKIVDILAKVLEIESSSIKDDMLFEEMPEWDSMLFVMVLSELEEAGISVPLEEAIEMKGVSELLTYAEKTGKEA